jgi:hypothetical protein
MRPRLLKGKKPMKRSASIMAMIGLLGISMTGCMSPQGRPDYTASGALAGGATGAVIGSLGRHPGAGALVGGSMGAVIGGLIGHGMDQEQEARLRARSPQTLKRVEQGQPLLVRDVEQLAKAGIHDDLIISQIRNSRTVYHLTTTDIIALKRAGVSDKVIDFMINTPSQTPSAQVAGETSPEPPPYPPQRIVVAPAPNYIWVPGAWLWFGGRRVWHDGYWHRRAHRWHRHHW